MKGELRCEGVGVNKHHQVGNILALFPETGGSSSRQKMTITPSLRMSACIHWSIEPCPWIRFQISFQEPPSGSWDALLMPRGVNSASAKGNYFQTFPRVACFCLGNKVPQAFQVDLVNYQPQGGLKGSVWLRAYLLRVAIVCVMSPHSPPPDQSHTNLGLNHKPVQTTAQTIPSHPARLLCHTGFRISC